MFEVELQKSLHLSLKWQQAMFVKEVSDQEIYNVVTEFNHPSLCICLLNLHDAISTSNIPSIL